MLSPLFLLLLVPPLLIWRLKAILPPTPPSRRRQPDETSALAVFLGSGGHTYESLALVGKMNPARYTPRLYIYCEGDVMSLKRVAELEATISASLTPEDAAATKFSTLSLPRARRVGQPFISSAFTTLKTLLHSLYLFFLLPAVQGAPFADLLLLNGPGTAVPIILAVTCSRFFGLPSPRMIYVESFARTRSLSATGKLVRPLVDRFLVQWEGALGEGKRTGPGEYVGVVV